MEALVLLAVLVCPIVMGTMMFLMWRGMRGEHGRRDDAPAAEPAMPHDGGIGAADAPSEPEQRVSLDGARDETRTLAEEEEARRWGMRRWLRPRRLLLVAVTALAAGVLVAGVLLASPGGSDSSAAKATPADDRKRAPGLEGEWLVGPPVRLADLRGKPTLINVWASWCVPCREEAPDLARFDREMRARAPLVGIDFLDAKGDALAFVREFGWRFPNVRDPQGELASRYGLAGLPTTYVIDRQGRIARTMTGAQTFEKLVRAVEEVEE